MSRYLAKILTEALGPSKSHADLALKTQEFPEKPLIILHDCLEKRRGLISDNLKRLVFNMTGIIFIDVDKR